MRLNTSFSFPVLVVWRKKSRTFTIALARVNRGEGFRVNSALANCQIPLSFFRKAKLLDHSKSPCVELQDFVPNTEGETYVFYFRKKNSVDFKTWRNIARCFRMWDLDNRGFHKSAWRFWIKKNHVIAIGCPASVYCKNKPEYLEPIALPDKVTRPRDPV